MKLSACVEESQRCFVHLDANAMEEDVNFQKGDTAIPQECLTLFQGSCGKF